MDQQQYLNAIAKAFQDAREKARLSMNGLAELADVSTTTISNLEAGRRLKGPTLDRIATALGLQLVVETQVELIPLDDVASDDLQSTPNEEAA